MNKKSTAAVIKDAAEVFREKARSLDRMADELEKGGEWEIAGEAISTIIHLSNIRVDLLALRPIRELEREVYKLNPATQHGDE
jgi:hypothetical protein